MKHLTLLLKCIFFLFLLTLVSCKDKAEDSDPCENVMCASYEVCNNGVCACPEGWAGSNCEEEIPSAIKVKKILISNVPFENGSGDPWDSSGDPDLAVALYTINNDLLWFSGVTDEVNISEEHTFVCEYTFISNLTGTYRIPITEWDDGEYDIIEILQFTPYMVGLGYPDTIVTMNIVQAKLVLEYSF